MSWKGPSFHGTLWDAPAGSGWRRGDGTLRFYTVQVLCVSGDGWPPERKKAENKGQKEGGRMDPDTESLRAHALESNTPGLKSPAPLCWLCGLRPVTAL